MAANDEYALIPADSPEKVDRHVEDTLKVKVIKLTVGRSPLLGVFTVMNNSGVLVPSIIRDEELEQLRKSLGDLNVAVLPSRYTAIANLILVNNKRGVVSPIVEREHLNIVRDNLNIELEVRDIRGLYIVGSPSRNQRQGYPSLTRGRRGRHQLPQGLLRRKDRRGHCE
jgi:Translation initiation factor 6 (eIF-6)